MLVLGSSGLFFTLHAQIPNTRDSLVMYLKNPPKDSNYVWALNRYARILVNETSEYDKADSLLKIAEPLALKYNYPLGKYANTRTRATLYYYKTDYLTALRYFRQAVEEAERFRLPPATVYEAYSNVATIQNQLYQYEESLKTSLRCIEIQEKYKLKPFASIYAGIGHTLKALKRPHEALAYLQKAIVIDQEQRNNKGLAVHYSTMGNIYDDLNQTTKALGYYQLALAQAKKANFLRGQTDYLVNIGRMYLKQGKTKEAIRVTEQSLRLAQRLEAVTSVAVAKFNLGRVYRTIEQPELAEKYYKEALAIAQEQNDKQSITEYQTELSDFYAEQKTFKKAYESLLASNVIEDSTNKVATQQQLQELIAKYETQTKEQQIKLLQQETQLKDQALLQSRQWLVGGVLALALAVAGIFLVMNRAKLRRLEEAQKLRNKIATDLHDEIGSTLSSISLLSGLTQKQLGQNLQKAERMIEKINSDAQQMLQAMDDIVWTINPRNDALMHLITRLREYAKPLAEAKNITLEFRVNADLENLSLPLQVRQNVYLIVKEALNNAFKYAQASQLQVEVQRHKEELHVAIVDNGVGFDTEATNSRNGLKNMQNRAEAVGGMLKIASVTGAGTRVILQVAVS